MSLFMVRDPEIPGARGVMVMEARKARGLAVVFRNAQPSGKDATRMAGSCSPAASSSTLTSTVMTQDCPRILREEVVRKYGSRPEYPRTTGQTYEHRNYS